MAPWPVPVSERHGFSTDAALLCAGAAMAIHRSVFLFLLGLLFVAVQAQAARPSVSILQSDHTRFHAIVSFSSSTTLDLMQAPDSAGVVQGSSLLLAVPPNYFPVLSRVVGQGVSENFSTTADKIAPCPLGTLGRPYWQRNRQLVNLLLAPVTASGVVESIELIVEFQPLVGARLALQPPPDDPVFDRIFGASLVNYDVARFWEIPNRTPLSRAAAAPEPFELTSDWFQLAVRNAANSNGTDLYKVTGVALEAAGMTLAGVPSSRLRLFSNGGLPLPIENSIPRPTFRELAVLVRDGGDGIFDRGDYLLFIGEQADRWTFSPDSQPSYVNNVYTDDHIYWLTTSDQISGLPARFGSRSATPDGNADTILTTTEGLVRLEQDNLISTDLNGNQEDYYRWYWSSERTLRLFASTPGAVAGRSADFVLTGLTNNCCDTVSFMGLRVNGIAGGNKSCNRTRCSFTSSAVVDGLNQFDLSIARQSQSIVPFFDYLECRYERRLAPSTDLLDATFPASDQLAELVIENNFSQLPLMLDLSDPQAPVELTSPAVTSATVTLSYQLRVGAVNRVLLSTENRAVSVASITRTTVSDLKAGASQADLIVVTPRQFTNALQPYLAYRAGQGHAIRLVVLEDIVAQFGFGSPDPTAIRDFLKYAFEQWPSPAPSHVLFVGDANYDFTDRLGTGQRNFVPVYIQDGDVSYSDDNYVFFGEIGLLVKDTASYSSGQGPDMIPARWPVQSSAEIAAIIDKIKRYESPASLGEWRTNVVLVADDEHTRSTSNETFHTTQTESLEKTTLPRLFERRKIYMWEYPFVNRLKPAVNSSIIDAFNDGSLLVNYVGHGNPDVWAHEQVLRRAADLPSISNRDRLPLVFAASCAIAFFDDPKREGMAEDFLSMEAGAIGVVAASRIVYSFDNSEFNKKCFEQLFGADSLSVADAVFSAKLLRQYRNGQFVRVVNDQQYAFLGDPLLRLARPRLSVVFDLPPDTLTPLARTTVRGSVLDPASGARVVQDGQLLVNVIDAEREKTYRLISNGVVTQQIRYKVPGPTIYRGVIPIVAGTFDFSFIPPVDMAFGKPDASIRVYAQLGGLDGAGLLDSLQVAQSVASSTDSSGPEITFEIAGRSGFVSGDFISQNDTIILRISDSSGINLSGSIGHGISLTIDDAAGDALDLTRSFTYADGSYTSGQIALPAEQIGTGNHRIALKVWDNANNSAAATAEVRIQSGEQLAIAELLNVPNPMIDSTTFYFQLTAPAGQFTLEIFSLSGRKIRSFTTGALAADAYPNAQSTLSWDGRDHAGDRVAGGVYIYKATAQAESGSEPIEQFGKIIVINQ